MKEKSHTLNYDKANAFLIPIVFEYAIKIKLKTIDKNTLK